MHNKFSHNIFIIDWAVATKINKRDYIEAYYNSQHACCENIVGIRANRLSQLDVRKKTSGSDDYNLIPYNISLFNKSFTYEVVTITI